MKTGPKRTVVCGPRSYHEELKEALSEGNFERIKTLRRAREGH